MKIFIENPEGTKLKKEYDKEERSWKSVGKVGNSLTISLRFLMGTMQKDGDPLDAFLITSKLSTVERGDVFEISVLGLAEYFEDDARDYKVIAKKEHEKVNFTYRNKSEIKYFLLHAFDNIPEKKVVFHGFSSIQKAQEKIERSSVTVPNDR